ncbi:hypothetical protein QO004_002815 [Rhizobium mesoamericanum]|nr:hypothetical protein [Rhizobium mesoamericanum]
MADEEVGEIVLPLQIAQVERRGRLIQHYKARLQHHRAGNGDTLALPTGEFVRAFRPTGSYG